MSVDLAESRTRPRSRLGLDGGDRPADAERARHLADLASVGADDGAGDVVARRQERERDGSLERATIRRVGACRLHAAGGAVECPCLRIFRDLEHHRRVLQDIRRFGVQLEVVVDRPRGELAADSRIGVARAGLFVGEHEIGGAHLADLGQAGAKRMLDTATPAAVVDHGNLQRVSAGRIAEDEPRGTSASRQPRRVS